MNPGFHPISSRRYRRLNAVRRFLLTSLIGFALNPGYVFAGSFNPERVIEDATIQCDFGPRIPGTAAHRQARDWIRGQLNELGMDVDIQPFPAKLELIGERVEGWNLWAVPKVESKDPLILLSAHWDTRPYADQDDRGFSRDAFPGANDGAASVAFVLEIVRALKGTAHENRLAVAFFDAEDSGIQGNPESWCLGSRFGAEHPPPWFDRVAFGLNIDMIASHDVKLRREALSDQAAPGEMDRLWKIGGDLAPRTFLQESRPEVMDDHVPFVVKGYRYIDLIGLPNPTWHKRSDTPENLDRRSIETVGQVLLEFLGQELRRLGAAEQAG